MSANPTRVDWPATASDPVSPPHHAKSGRAGDPVSPLPDGNRVLESIARHEALRALLAFSDLHEQIRNRRPVTGRVSDRDWFETERFILDEVLQLICDRVQAITHADGIVVALAEESKAERSPAERPEMVCRAAAGRLAVERDLHLAGESKFLQECLETGRILRCDDCEIDNRVKLDSARQVGARSTLLIPLRGWRQQLGVLQVFSRTPWAFTDHDVRCFDLFAELVLCARKPEDQDRRIHWLSDVAGQVLRPKPAAPVHEAAAETELAPSPTAPTPPDPSATHPDPELAMLDQFELQVARVAEPEFAEFGVADDAFEEQSLETPETPIPEPTIAESTPAESRPSLSPLSFLRRPAFPGSSHPGMSVVMGLVAVAALFSAGAWWGMQVHGKTAVTRVAASLAAPNAAALPPAVTAPPAPGANALFPAVSDNLMHPSQLESDTAPLTAVAEDKLAALPKVMGVRHWSSSVGSTVVIDMEDQVPYEVHRLMSPERIYFDLHDTGLAPELDGKTMDVGDPSLTRVRVAQPVAGVTRIVLDTKDGSNFSVSMESSPYRLVVELRNSGKTLAANKSAPNQITPNQVAPSRAPSDTGSPNLASSNQTTISLELSSLPVKAAPVAALAAKALDQPLPARTFPVRIGKFRIVLDAGHGGWDLGTVGRQGLLEKDLVLDVTQRLGKLLQARLGSEVIFTRTDDTYLPLEQRADFANHAQADLFVSVHANYSTSASARGVETYYTNLFSAPGSREVDKHDDGTFSQLTPVSLSAGGLHEKIEESRRLAASVQHSLYSTLASNSPTIRNRGIKDSAFVVLTGTTMPAILTEISFVSSPADEHNLQSAAYRQQIAEALYKGIAGYEQSAPHAKIAQLQKPDAR
jgi:N-acetylmuramoyl-L-alanine amidase